MLRDSSPGLPNGDDDGTSAKRCKVSRACDRCKARKRRCDGDQPCSLCTSHNVHCRYDTPYSRGRPPLPRNRRPSGNVNDGAHPGGSSAETTLRPSTVSAEHGRNDLLNAVLGDEAIANGISRSSRAASPNADGIVQPGHYLGPTSTFSFLRRAGRKFGRLAGEARDPDAKADVSIFANGDINFFVEAGDGVEFPDDTKMSQLVNRYFDFAVPTHRFFHQQTVERWVREFREPTPPEERTLRPVREAAMLLILATALLYKVDQHGNATGGTDSVIGFESDSLRERYFHAAHTRLQNEKGVARLESVQARLAAVLYLLNTSRLNQAWYMLGTTYQLIIALGLHSAKPSTGFSKDCIMQECKKRSYWVAFTVDTYLSVMLGRPPLMSEHGVDQQYPEMANDENITAESVSHGPKVRDCVQAAPIFHTRLIKIIREASREQYLAQKRSSQRQIDTAQRLNDSIAVWHQELPVYLSGGIHPSTLVPIFRRQLRALQMAEAHATMLVNRPLILSAHKNLELSRPHIEHCLSAAHRVLEMVLELVEHNHLFRAFWNFQYITFHALSVVYVWIIQLKGERAAPALQTPIFDRRTLCEKAEKVQGYLAEATQANAPNLRYSIILEEMKQEALRALNKRRAPETQHFEQNDAGPADGEYAEVAAQQTSTVDSLSDWDSMLDFPTDPELWLQLDSFPFDDFGFQNGLFDWQ